MPNDLDNFFPPAPTAEPATQADLVDRAMSRGTPPPAPPSPPNLLAVHAYLTERRVDLLQRVQEIETFLGFIEGDSALAVRIGKIEQFLGIKG